MALGRSAQAKHRRTVRRQEAGDWRVNAALKASLRRHKLSAAHIVNLYGKGSTFASTTLAKPRGGGCVVVVQPGSPGATPGYGRAKKGMFVVIGPGHKQVGKFRNPGAAARIAVKTYVACRARKAR